jgi:glutathione-regulated potassium-efflux system ancillary protein KefF
VSRAVTLIYGHPYPARSQAGRVLLDGVRDLPGVEVRSLYDLYPDFDIDVQAEQAALLRADLIIWQCPFYWYGVPALLNLWFEKVLAHGWAYGEGADALSGKTVLWVPTTGGSPSNYSETDVHGHPFEAFVPAISQVARFCGMRWAEPPLVVHAAHRLTHEELRAKARHYRRRIESLASELEAARG